MANNIYETDGGVRSAVVDEHQGKKLRQRKNNNTQFMSTTEYVFSKYYNNKINFVQYVFFF